MWHSRLGCEWFPYPLGAFARGSGLLAAKVSEPGEEAAPMSLSVYKKGQGTAARGLAGVLAVLVGGWAARSMYFYGSSGTFGLVMTTLTALFFGGLPLYLVLFHRRVVDILIETQQEIRKVAWSSRSEVIGSTIVVVFVVALLSVFILVTDFVILRVLFGTLLGLY